VTFKETCHRRFLSARTEIDTQFLPYLDRINALPFVASSQCCVGHVHYTMSGKRGAPRIPKRDLPVWHTGRWGYLHMAVTVDVHEFLHETARRDGWESWLWIQGSQLWAKGAKTPCLCAEDEGWAMIAFAWDAKHWPQPIEDIASAVERYAPRVQLCST
jgi:hypothetical protein